MIKVCKSSNPNLVTYEFRDDIWKVNDNDWLTARSSLWNRSTFKNVAAQYLFNSNEIKEYRRYFLKGEWNPESRLGINNSARILLAPMDDLSCVDLILDTLKSDEERANTKYGVIKWLSNPNLTSEPSFLDGKEKVLIENLLNVELTVTSATDEMLIKEFSKLISRNTFDFFIYFIDVITSWLKDNYSSGEFAFQYFYACWLNNLKHVSQDKLNKKRILKRVKKLFELVSHFSAPYPSNCGATEKIELVLNFKKALDAFELEGNVVADLWAKTRESKGDEWVDKIINVDLKEIELKDNNGLDSCVHLVLRESNIGVDAIEQIANLYRSYEFVDSTFKKDAIRKVSVDKNFTKQFLDEVGSSNLYGLCYRMQLNKRFLGTERADVGIDLVLVKSAEDESVSRLVIVERPKLHYAIGGSIASFFNRNFMISALQKELGMKFVRYYGFSEQHQVKDHTMTPREQVLYSRLMEEGVFDANYYVLKTGPYGLLNEDYYDFTELE